MLLSRYRLQNALFALRRYLPGPLRRWLKPLYRRWWQRTAFGRRAAARAAPSASSDTPGYALVCLSAVDWELRFQRPQQLLSRLALSGHRVYYLRTDFATGQAPDPLEPLAPNVYGLRLPGPSHLDLYQALPSAERVAHWVSLLQALAQAERLIVVVALVQSPFWGPLALALRERLGWRVVYDCLDDHAGFASNAPAVLTAESALVSGSDLVLTTARRLYERWTPLARRCRWLPNAAAVEHFAQAAPQRHPWPRPVVGYFGALAEWFAVEWIEAAAEAHPEWTFVLIGLNSGVDLRCLERRPNIHLLGELPYAVLPAWLHAFDAAVIPFKLNDLTRATNPVKFFEYLSAGKPVVATDLDELAPHAELFYPARDPDGFVRQLEAAVAERSPAAQAARVAFAQANAWPARVAEFERAVAELYGEAVIVIVSYGNREYLQLCLESVWSKTHYPRYRVVVVDNASGPAVAEYLRAEQAREPRLTVLFNRENVGFARANNQGVAAAGDCDYVVLLNDDTVVTRGWLSRLLAHLSLDPTLGLVGPLTNWSSTAATVTAGYERLEDLEAFAARATGPEVGGLDFASRLDMFCVALRRAVLAEIGPLDEAFGLGMFEDDDYALRLSRAGYRLGVASDVFVHHWGWASFGRLDQAEYDRVFAANQRYFEEKWGQRWQRLPPRVKPV